jgi:hypothetical protein
MACPAFAQGPYVSASVGVTVSRFSSIETDEIRSTTEGGESASWGLRVGTPLGASWGVELEFARALRSDDEDNFNIGGPLPAGLGGRTVLGLYDVSPVSPTLPVFPVDFNFRVRTQRSAVTPTIWYQADVSRRVAMVFLGGVAFNRSERETALSVPPLPRGILLDFGPTSTRTVTYDTGAVVGVEARLGLGDHVQLIPGARLQGLGGGWSVRPAVGLGWQF